MKKLFFTFLIGLSLTTFSQAPQEISYQGVARNASGSLLANQNIGIKLDLHQGSAGGAVVFSETHNKTTNAFGLFTLGIGSVNTAAFTAINWANGPYFMEVSMDPAGGSSYTSVGTQQFMSVPYALYAKTAGNASPTPTITINAPNTVTSASGGYTINIPASVTYSAGTGISVTGTTISNTAPDQTVVLNAAGSATVTGTYPSFTINTPTAQVYTAGNGIDITGGVISNTAAAVTPTILGAGATTVTGVYPNLTINTPTVAPDQAVSLTGTGTATVTGSYPNFTVNVPSGTSLPTGFNGQFLFNNGTIWDTLPRTNLFFDGTNFGVGTTAPQANFHVIGGGRFDASVSTPQIYTNAIHIAVGTFTNAGDVLTNDGAGNGIWQSLPTPTLSYNNGTNVLSLNQGTTVTTATLNGTGSNTVSMVGSGLATVTPTTGSTFTVSVPSPTFTNAGPTTITGAYPNYTVSSTSTPSTTLVQGNNVSLNNSGNTYTISAVTPTITGTGATTVTGTYPNLTINTPTAAAAATPTITGSGNAVVTPTTGNVFTVNVPTQTLTVTSNSVITSNLGGTATITPAVLSYTPGTNTLKLTDGLSVNTVTLNSTSATSLTQGANVTVVGSAPNYTVSAPAYSISIPGGNVVQITNGVSTSTSAINATNLTLTGTSNNILSAGGNTVALNTYTTGTGITMTGTAPNYTLSSPNQSLSIAGNSLSITGGNTVTIPPSSINGLGTGIATVTTSVNNFTVNVPSPTYTAATGVLSFGGTNTVVVNPALALSGTTLTSGASTNSVNLSSLSVWSNSVGVLYPTTLTNSVGVGTSGPLTDKMEIKYASTTANTHLHLKQIGADAFSRIKFTNAVAPSKFWLSTVTSAASDANSGYNFFYNNGSIGHNIFTVAGDGLVSVNPFSTMNNARFYVGGKVKIDSSLTMAAYISQPTLAPPNEGRIYYDRATQKFKVSENGLPYVDMIGGGGSSPWLQGAGIITQNNTGDLVGIGTPAPTSQLHVSGISDPLQITVENGGGNFSTGYHIKTALSEWFMGQDGSSSTGFRITDKDAFAVRFQIDQDGRTGIGTTFPTEKLDVNGNVKLDSSLMVTGMWTVPPTSFGGNGRIYFDQSSGKFKVSENGNPYVDMIGGGSSPWMQGAGVITQMNLGDKVGIGTAAPDFPLDIRTTSDVLINLSSSASTQGTQAGLRLSMFDGYIGKQYTLAAEKSDPTVNSGSSDFVIKSHYSTAGGTLNNLVIKNQDLIFNESKTTGFDFGNVIVANGYLGVGTGFPSAKLDVNGNIKADSSLIVSGMGTVPPISFGGSGRIFFDQVSGKFKVSENGSGYVDLVGGLSPWTYNAGSIFPSNNSIMDKVGIGTNTPSSLLHVVSSPASPNQFLLGNSNQPTREWEWNVDATSNLSLINEGNGTPFTSMFVENTGKIGIGTTSPLARLHTVNSTSAGSSGRFENSSSTNTADAVFVINSGSGAAIHAVSAATSTVGLWLENGHLKSTQSSPPTVATVSTSISFSGATYTLTNGTDVKGNLLAVCTTTSGLSVYANSAITFRVTFNKSYQISPTVVITPVVDMVGLSYFVSGVTNNSFNITIKNSSATTISAPSLSFGFNYMVIE